MTVFLIKYWTCQATSFEFQATPCGVATPRLKNTALYRSYMNVSVNARMSMGEFRSVYLNLSNECSRKLE